MSLKKIAEMVGVSPSTVSRVLNGTVSSCASPALKEKIWEAARSINYIPNANARDLKKGTQQIQKNYQISIVLSRFGSLDTDPFFRELFQHIEECLFTKSCELCSVFSADAVDYQALENTDGIIILGRCSEKLLTSLKDYTKNIVGIDRNPTNYNIDEIVCDGKVAATQAMEYLLSLGHQKIGYIGDCTSESRYIGYCETLITKNIPLNYHYIKSTSQTYDSGYQAMLELIPTDLTAVFCANDITALGALKALSDYNTKNGKNKDRRSIISIDNIASSQTSNPLLTTINIPKEDMGKMAVTILLDRIKHGHLEYLRLEFPCRIVERDSCFQA